MEAVVTWNAISPIVKSAAAAIAKLLADEGQLSRDDGKYYGTYLEVAAQAVRGLESEYVGILTQAANCDLADEKERKALLVRIDEYIHGEVLRPRLKEAIERLREGRAALQQHAERLLIWPTVKQNRKAALEKFDGLLDALSGYLGSLGDYVGPSARALDDLREIKTQLAAVPPDPRKFADFIGTLLMNLDKSALMSDAGNCGRVIEVLRIAFR